ncbi:menaquinone-dependent protoporphyrinogen IX dehydrogenase [Shewanella intestini]|uniref:Protoporphyrinogen IX dehydrogenase [quinone] n=1 Tax=Shewanella intestini TaxID=2017544 RepID=A0ABS5I820_9GAMM|nr:MULTISPECIES: menaquinone-dependent protoporphyrinogen IX dehydrogenase [Shewanella]MBR9729460.1 menaquinone-dependent protoporphyrinogen IX dehydrogenase [Shewanella intestini]MRG35079.1 menaquinone-dependent protoporphyrinogen IX dehydrogenase [Shewanella sp. XMDDZSB0408]
MSQILLIHSSVHGQTVKICQYMQEKARQQGAEITLATLADNPSLDGFDKVFFGASIRHGKHRAGLYQFIEANKDKLEQLPSGFFSVSLVARKPGKNTADTNMYMQAFLKQSVWQPKILEVFGGNLDYQHYPLMDRYIIRFIMWLTKGPTDLQTKIEYTDWDKVDAFVERMIHA